MRKEDVKKAVREGYAQVAKQESSCCAPSGSCCGGTIVAKDISKAIGYSDEEMQAVPEGANLGLGCGNPVALASLKEGEVVLDLGSGVGGPARTIAAEYGCHVTGIDLVEEYCRTAEILTGMLGLGGSVTFRQGDMTDMPFEDGSFDRALTMHTQMNVEDKSKLFNEVSRVLKPGGLFALYEICAGPNSPLHFPVPWADDLSISFLIAPDELRGMLKDTGFGEIAWRDVSAPSLTWFQIQLELLSSVPKDAPPPLGLNLIMGPSFAEKFKNVFTNLKEDRVRVVQGVYQTGE